MVRQETIVKGCMPVNIVAMPLDTVASDKGCLQCIKLRPDAPNVT